MFTVKLKKQAQKSIDKMPVQIVKRLFQLVDDLERSGSIQSSWPNYSRLSENEFHCHLSHKWVACWRHENNSIIIEVYYAGSRENAPY